MGTGGSFPGCKAAERDDDHLNLVSRLKKSLAYTSITAPFVLIVWYLVTFIVTFFSNVYVAYFGR
jgi:hypothetical protein